MRIARPSAIVSRLNGIVNGISPNARLFGDDSRTGPRKPPVARALGVSLLAHIAGLLIIAWVTTRPARNLGPSLPPESDMPAHIVWVPVIGPSKGGGGREGNGKREPSRSVELPGKDALTVPVVRPPVVVPAPKPADVPTPTQQISIPAITTTAGIQELVGVVAAAPSVPADSLGLGNGPGGDTGKGTGSGPGDGAGLGPGRDRGTGGDVYQPGNGTSAPQLVREMKPTYTPEAMRARVQGMVVMQAIVLADGSVGPAKIMRSLDATFGLDQEALRTVKQWRFLPGRRGGKPVNVLVEVEMMFTLR